MENNVELGLHGSNTDLSDENNDDVEGESNKIILYGESEAML